MKVEAIFSSNDCPRIKLTPENDGEKRLLGSVLSNRVVGAVEVKYEGHTSYGRAELVAITLFEPAPAPVVDAEFRQ